ncbi:hypothetical protein [Pedobacter kyonggii]|uniref:Uncharacterized protein n=1 Tax=Pedobacter kyonggii TaxID=1926871 RepID=A0A4Q9H322_9SPHI|nr:hypothetical protein [Pedobacter kyonggii]TBO35945.1 hypothetical protein EYS08_25395 [Pedobacter kyonggii]
MGNQLPTSEDLEAYHRVKRFFEATKDLTGPVAIKSEGRFSLIPKKYKWVFIIALAIAAFSTYYAVTTLIFGQEFWVRSIAGPARK